MLANIRVSKRRTILMSAKLLVAANRDSWPYLRLCIDIGPICDQHFDDFCLSSEGCYVQCCVSFLELEMVTCEKSAKLELEYITKQSRTSATLEYSISC